jgi:uracil-DNA glycosylase family 4
MDALRRNQYLQTIGVDVWVPRRPAADAGAAAEQADSQAPAPSAARVPCADIGAAARATQATTAADSSPHTARADGAGRAPAQATPMLPGATTSHSAQSSVVASPAEGSPTVITWETLRSEVLACTKCTLHGSRTQGVFGVGNREAQWLVVGEAPGAEEDRRGEPFVGRAGHLLDAMLKAIGLSRGRNVYIANVLKSRPPGNRDPKPEEVAACLPYLMRQIELLKPRVMLAVGRIAAQNLLATDVPLGRLRGKVHHFGELNTPLIVTYHPAYLLRTPSDKRKAWEDLKFARSVFQGLNPT